MKKISEHLGEIIVALAGVALLIAAITLFKAPIGDFYSNIVKSELDVGNKVLAGFDDVNVTPNIGGGGSGSDEGTGEDDGTDEPFVSLGKYMTGVTSKELGDYTGATQTFTSGEFVDLEPAYGDVYVYGDYEYRYNAYLYNDSATKYTKNEFDGWSVRVLNTSKKAYGEILTEINGKPIVSAQYTFARCLDMETAPAIPATVTSMEGTFYYCPSLLESPVIPNGVVNLAYAYSLCDAMAECPVIPNGVTNMEETFYCCSLIKTPPAIPSTVTNMKKTFGKCDGLTTAPVIPYGVTDLYGTFEACILLTTAPAIPASVIEMDYTFSGCSALKAMPAIPDSVISLCYTFYSCTSLTTASTIPENVIGLIRTFWKCTALTGTIEINATVLNSHTDCFLETTQPITLTGSSRYLDALAATASNGNVTVQN